MRKWSRWWFVLGLIPLGLMALAAILWFSVSHQPEFYRATAAVPRERRQAGARHFVEQSLQLRNDIVNEAHWEAAFTAEEVNSWLAEDLLKHFADQIPAGVHEPRVAFELDRVTLAFQLDEGPIRSVIWVVARVEVPEGNVVALTLEKIRAGLVPIPAENFIDRISAQAQRHGLNIEWTRHGDEHVAMIRYTTDPSRSDIVLERIQLLDGQIRLGGRSNRDRGTIVSPRLPRRTVLQSAFPSRNLQTPRGVSLSPAATTRHNSAIPET